MNVHEKINYVEWPAKNLIEIKAFFEVAFGWSFVDYGDEYTSFSGQGVDGGFYLSELCSSSANGGALIVFYSVRLSETQEKIEKAGGKIIKPVFSFPGGRRFHFSDPCGNEYAVWSDIDN